MRHIVEELGLALCGSNDLFIGDFELLILVIQLTRALCNTLFQGLVVLCELGIRLL